MDELTYDFPFKKMIKRRKKRIIDKWLVGTYNGMILVSELITEKELASGEGILRAAFLHFQELEDAMELQWYTAPFQIELGYSMELRVRYKDKIFMTMQELGISNFTPVKMTVPQCLEKKE